MQTQRLELELTMTSDWHVGCGFGRPGNIDRLVARDHLGLPFVPAKTLTGMLRDACERLTRGLDDQNFGPWSAWVSCLFGDQPARKGETVPTERPRPAIVEIRSAHYEASFARQLTDNPELRQALTFVKPGVKINSRNGRALDEHLRFDEMARIDSRLVASVLIHLPEKEQERTTALALLTASAALVERLGGKRRRGSGRCQVKLLGQELSTALKFLETNAKPPIAPARPQEPEFGQACLSVPVSPDWVSIPYSLTLQSSISVAKRLVGNVTESLDFIPGTMLLPHFTRSAQRELRLDLTAAVASGDFQVSPATLDLKGVAGRALPFAMHRRKEAPEEGNVHVVNELVSRGNSVQEKVQYKQMRTGYLGQTSAEFTSFGSPTLQVRTHNTVDEESQRPSERVGGVFSYEALAPGQILRGEIRLRRELWTQISSQANWQSKLEDNCCLGRSKKDDYGRVLLKLHSPVSRQNSATPSSTTLTVWLLSDLLLRDERLRPAADAETLAQELTKQLGLSAPINVIRRFTRVRRTDSWNTRWTLPRPSLIGLQAGSCFVMELPQVVSTTDLQAVEQRGIGERTAEGFGCIRFNDPLLGQRETTLQKLRNDRELAAAPTHTTKLSRADRSFAFAEVIEREHWRDKIFRRAMELARPSRGDHIFHWQVNDHDSKPPMSQLGGLRNVVAQVQSWADRDLVMQWLEHRQATPRRADRWPKDSFVSLLSLFKTPDKVWDLFDTATWSTLTAQGATRLKTMLWGEAIRALIGACIQSQKRELDRRSQNKQEQQHGA